MSKYTREALGMVENSISKARAYFERSPGAPDLPAGPEGAGFQFVRDDGDVAERIPSPVAEKLRAMRQDARDAHAALIALSDEMQETRVLRLRADARLRELMQDKRVREGDASIITARASAERAAATLQRLQVLHSERQARWQAAAGPLAEIEGYLKSLSGARIALAEPLPPPKLVKGEHITETVQKVRGKIAELQTDAQSVEDAVLPAAVAKAIARAQIEAIAAKGEPNTLQLIEGRERLGLPTKMGAVVSVIGTDKLATVTMPAAFDTTAFLFWLCKDAIVARVDSLIDENADDASALTDEQRGKKHLQIQAAILEQERVEEQLVEMASSQAVAIHRRRDADPRAVLGLSDAMPAPRGF